MNRAGEIEKKLGGKIIIEGNNVIISAASKDIVESMKKECQNQIGQIN